MNSNYARLGTLNSVPMLPARTKSLKYSLSILLLISLLYILLPIYQEIRLTTEYAKQLISPRGVKLPKLRTDITFKKFANLSTTCAYRGLHVHCPDIRHYGESVLRQTQLTITRMLRVLDVITRKHGINFWICSGTLLGAVRHQGFIPWDNDADICILREDYNKFVDKASSDLPSDIFLQNYETDLEFKNFTRCCDAKLRDTSSCYGTCLPVLCKQHDGLHIDFFVLDKKKDFLQDKFGHYKVQYDDIFPLIELYFEGYKMPAPKNWKEILVKKYGNDYMSLPPAGRRCPTGELIGIPWYSCKKIEILMMVEREQVLRDFSLIRPYFADCS